MLLRYRICNHTAQGGQLVISVGSPAVFVASNGAAASRIRNSIRDIVVFLNRKSEMRPRVKSKNALGFQGDSVANKKPREAEQVRLSKPVASYKRSKLPFQRV